MSGVSDIGADLDSKLVNTVYNDDGKVSYIIAKDDSCRNSLYLTYGPEREKWTATQYNYRFLDKHSFALVSSADLFYGNNYVRKSENNSVTEQYFLDNGVILIQKDGELDFYQSFVDSQGSILSVFDRDGNQVFKASYDAWGIQTLSRTTSTCALATTGMRCFRSSGSLTWAAVCMIRCWDVSCLATIMCRSRITARISIGTRTA